MSTPSTSMRPESGFSRRISWRKNTVLPEPLAPEITLVRPRWISKVTPLRIGVPP